MSMHVMLKDIKEQRDSHSEPIVQVRGVHKRFGTLEVLKGIDLDIAAKSVTTVVGPSGAGKTTLLQIIGTLMPAEDGIVRIGGVEVTSLGDKELSRFRNDEIGFVFQFHHLLAEFTALDNVCIPALIRRENHSKARERAAELLDYLGLSSRMQHKPQELSGGEQQRVAVARALINHPRIILADEPSGNLDLTNRRELHSLFFRLRDEMGKTFIIVTHDEQLAAQSDRVVRMVDGLLEK